jgi:mRNA interferase HigB
MKVHLIKSKTVKTFARRHASSISSFNRWLRRLSNVHWETANDIKSSFPSADLLGKGSNRVIFDIGGNNYRILCKYQFGKNMVHLFVLWIGTHAEYDKLCEDGKQYTIERY